MPESGYIGASIPRREDIRFLTGRATFVDDIRLDRMTHAAIVRSPHAHARILGLDASRALALEGVCAVLTYADFAEIAKPIPLRLADVEPLDRPASLE